MKKILLLFPALCCSSLLLAQSFNVEEDVKALHKATPLRFNGGISANSVFYTGNNASVGRAPFTYFLQGNVSVNVLGKVNLPFSFNLTNNGSGFDYPILPNRLSLHPTYRWITAHIGNIAMSFSPYTLNGYQFAGAGVDLLPEGPFKFSAMYGRLNRAVEPDSTNRNVVPSYRRIGYGFKAAYEKTAYRLGVIVFAGRDDPSSLRNRPDSLLIFPGQNLVVSWSAGIKPLKGMEITVEHATSALTRNVRDTTLKEGETYLSRLMRPNNSTAYFTAYKAQLNYVLAKSTVGLGYERVAPGYQTMGAYFFNSDLENITLNLAQSFLKGKATAAGSLGIQRDNLDNAKATSSRRLVSSIQVSYTPSPKLQATASYSNFRSFMNIRPQFQIINQPLPFQNIDTLNYIQISKNFNTNLNFNFQDASDRQGGVVTNGNASQFFNLATAYTYTLLKTGISFITAYNATYNTIGRNSFLTMGPTLGINARLLDKKLTTGFSGSYNTSSGQGSSVGSVLNLRANAALRLEKKHSLTLNLINQNRQAAEKSTSDFTLTFGYNYTFL
jgi:hypothetical protein